MSELSRNKLSFHHRAAGSLLGPPLCVLAARLQHRQVKSRYDRVKLRLRMSPQLGCRVQGSHQHLDQEVIHVIDDLTSLISHLWRCRLFVIQKRTFSSSSSCSELHRVFGDISDCPLSCFYSKKLIDLTFSPRVSPFWPTRSSGWKRSSHAADVLTELNRRVRGFAAEMWMCVTRSQKV